MGRVGYLWNPSKSQACTLEQSTQPWEYFLEDGLLSPPVLKLAIKDQAHLDLCQLRGIDMHFLSILVGTT